eukprot:3372626-Rhodomonas_salina.3
MMTAPYAKIPGSFPNGRSCAIQRPGLIKPTRGSLSPRSSSEAGNRFAPDVLFGEGGRGGGGWVR